MVLPVAAVLPCLLALADTSKPAKLQEAVADGLCALASHDWARTQLINAGVLVDSSITGRHAAAAQLRG